jgi:hypothetical protein
MVGQWTVVWEQAQQATAVTLRWLRGQHPMLVALADTFLLLVAAVAPVPALFPSSLAAATPLVVQWWSAAVVALRVRVVQSLSGPVQVEVAVLVQLPLAVEILLVAPVVLFLWNLAVLGPVLLAPSRLLRGRRIVAPVHEYLWLQAPQLALVVPVGLLWSLLATARMVATVISAVAQAQMGEVAAFKFQPARALWQMHLAAKLGLPLETPPALARGVALLAPLKLARVLLARARFWSPVVEVPLVIAALSAFSPLLAALPVAAVTFHVRRARQRAAHLGQSRLAQATH